MDLYVSDTEIVVAVHGTSALFRPGVPRPLRPSLIGPALSAGARLVAAEPTAPVAEEISQADVVAAIRELMESGDPKVFGVTGEPKLSALRKKLGQSLTDAQRDAAWAVVKAEG